MKGTLVILSGPSGVGKDQALCAWRGLNPKVRRVVSYTTRLRAEAEVDGVDYHFVTQDRFLELAGLGAFLEYKHVHDRYYGTPIEDMERSLEAGLIAVLKIDVQGALEIMPKRPDAVTIFVSPPSWEELERRIRARGRDDEVQIAIRLEAARWEMEQRPRYQYEVVNETGQLIETARKIDAIVRGS